MRILWRYHLALEFPEEISALQRQYPDVEQIVASSREEFRVNLPEADVVVSPPLSEHERSEADRLKAHFLPYAGVNRLPLSEYAERGIIVANSHGNADVVAERALALAMAAAGRIVEFHNGLREGLWARRRSDAAQIFEYWRSLQGARCACVGVGRIAHRIAELMQGFQCSFTGVRRRSNRELSANNAPQAAQPFDRISTDLINTLRGAEVVFLALPLTPETEGLIGPEAIEAMDGAILVNVSRGEIVAERALYRALASRSGDEGSTGSHPEGSPAVRGPSAAGIDCWWLYPDSFETPQLPSRLPFHRLNNVCMSPHAASHTVEGKRGQMAETVENIQSYLETGIPKHSVDLESGY